MPELETLLTRKLARLGALTNDIAHEFNNILQGLVLAGIIWTVSTVETMKETVILNDYRLDRIEAELKQPH